MSTSNRKTEGRIVIFYVLENVMEIHFFALTFILGSGVFFDPEEIKQSTVLKPVLRY